MLYNICPDCGASLDPNERCDCLNKKPLEKIESNADCVNYLFAIMGGTMNGGNKKAR